MNATVSLDRPVRRRADAEITDLVDALVITNSSGQHMFGVNGVGRRIVVLLEQAQTIPDLVGTLVREYRISPAECESDVRAFLGELSDQALIENC